MIKESVEEYSQNYSSNDQFIYQDNDDTGDQVDTPKDLDDLNKHS